MYAYKGRDKYIHIYKAVKRYKQPLKTEITSPLREPSKYIKTPILRGFYYKQYFCLLTYPLCEISSFVFSINRAAASWPPSPNERPNANESATTTPVNNV